MPPGVCDKQDRTTVAAFRPWRGLPALNPHPLTASRTMEGLVRNSMVRVDFFETSRLQDVGSREENQSVGLREGGWKRSRESDPSLLLEPSPR